MLNQILRNFGVNRRRGFRGQSFFGRSSRGFGGYRGGFRRSRGYGYRRGAGGSNWLRNLAIGGIGTWALRRFLSNRRAAHA